MTSGEAFVLGRSLHQAGDLAGAEAAYREAVYRGGRNADAIALISGAAQTFPTDPSVLLTQWIILTHEGRFDQAVEVIRSVIGHCPDG